MKICVPTPDVPGSEKPNNATWLRRLNGPVGVIDNAKPGFDVLVRKVLAELVAVGARHDDSLYVQKTTATRAAEPPEIDRIAEGAIAVIVGSGD